MSMMFEGSEEGFINLDDGLRLFYRSYGSGPTLVLLHGGPGMSFMGVGPDLLPLAEDRRLLMYDQRGGGRSDPDPNYSAMTAETHARDLESVRRHFGLERMTLVGHSWGCVLAAIYAAEHPERVERLILLGPMEPSRQLLDVRQQVTESVVGTADMEERTRRAESQVSADDPEALCRAAIEPAQRFYDADPSKKDQRLGDYCDVPADAFERFRLIVKTVEESLGDYDVRPLLATLHMPALVVEGAQSPLPLEGEREWARSLPGARLWLIDQVGHAYPFVEAPDVFFSGIARFLEGDWPEGAITLQE